MEPELSGSHPGPEESEKSPKKNREAAPRNIPEDAPEIAARERLPDTVPVEGGWNW